ncbi:MAG: hypothetical protein ACRDHD_01445 [Candidatus Limnocylindria bacterium]
MGRNRVPRRWCRGARDSVRACAFFSWYNTGHRHAGIALYTPADVHHGRVPELEQARASTLAAAYAAHPERFVRHPPRPPELPTAVWINKPLEKEVPTQ